MPHANIMKNFQWKVMQLCVIYQEQDFLIGQVKASRVGWLCSVSKGGRLGDWILLVLMRQIHAAMAFSYFPHVDMVN